MRESAGDQWDPGFIVGCCNLIGAVDSGYILVQESKPPAWSRYNFPAGSPEVGETLAEAAEHEAEEETGLSVSVSHLIGIYQCPRTSEGFGVGRAPGVPKRELRVPERRHSGGTGIRLRAPSRQRADCRHSSGCSGVVLVQSDRLYSAAGRIVRIVVEGRLRLTGRTSVVATPRHC